MFKGSLIITVKANKRQLHARVRREAKKDKPLLTTEEEKLKVGWKPYARRNKCMSEVEKKMEESCA